MIGSRLRFLIRSLKERLWVQPLGYAVLPVGAILAARLTDGWGFGGFVPVIAADPNEKLLTVIAASMLGVATFAVASMVAAYAAAGGRRGVLDQSKRFGKYRAITMPARRHE